MNVLFMVLLVASVVCFALAAANVRSRVSLLALGLLCWVLVPAIQLVRAL